MPHTAFVGGLGGAAEPTLVDPATIGSVGIQIVRMQLNPPSWVQKAPWNPGRGQPEQTAAGLHGVGKDRSDIISLDDIR